MDKYTNPEAHPTAAGEFTDGDPLLDIPRTLLLAQWPNMIQRELVNLVEGAGLTLNGASFTQVLQAVLAIAQTNGFQTGDIKYSYRPAAPAGWLVLDGTTIGSAASGATQLAGISAQPLYLFLWDTFGNSLCPVSGGRGASAQADWDADKTLTLFDDRGEFHRIWDNGRGIDDGRALGSWQQDEFKSHDHPVSVHSGNWGNYGTNAWGSSVDNAEQDTGPAGGDETRPRNRAVNVFIKL